MAFTRSGNDLKAELRYDNLTAAGALLAEELSEFAERTDVVVLAVALGGFPVAVEVAKALKVPLDLILLKRLFPSGSRRSRTCAVCVAGSFLLDGLPPIPELPSSPVEWFLKEELDRFSHRERLCRAGRPPLDLTGKTVIVVDCAIRSGSTMLEALESVRSMGPARVIAAVPIAAPETASVVEAAADELICPRWPEIFGNAAVWYSDFNRPYDAYEFLLVERLLG
jgi:putative phosphoribosyl transferase